MKNFLSVFLLSFWFLLGCEQAQQNETLTELDTTERDASQRLGAVYTAKPSNMLALPKIEEVSLPFVEDIDAIWGATGRDDAGNIYFGTSSHGGEYGSSYLYQFNPNTKQLIAQSDVVEQLKLNGLYRQSMRQNKLHSKFFQANDGYVYFSSFDEGGEAENVNPTWGGHLWRKKPHDKNWQHVLATEEALVAVNTNGRYVYALGYWDHVLYQYDVETAAIKRVVVGSVNMHVSRNFIVDELGHVYVPQLTFNDFNEVQITLAEYDVNLTLIANYDLPSYSSEKLKSHHGIVAYTGMNNGDIIFTSSEGGLYQIKPFSTGEDKVVYKGMMHPNGEAYIASLFTADGQSIIYGLGREKRNAEQYDWLAFELGSSSGFAKPIKIPVKKPLLYGTLTKDNKGAMYVAGWQASKKQKYQPAILKLSW